MAEPTECMRALLAYVFEGDPDAHARIAKNSIFGLFESGAAGVHELVSTLLLARVTLDPARTYDHVIIDTAPSRQALDLLSYPGKLSALLEGRTASWLAGIADAWGANDDADDKRGSGVLGWGRRKIEKALFAALGKRFFTDLAAGFSDVARVRERFAWLARRAEGLLLGDACRYAIVAAPTRAARDDGLHLAKALAQHHRTPALWVINRADTSPPAWAIATRDAQGTPEGVKRLAQGILDEYRLRADTASHLQKAFHKASPAAACVRLPFVEAREPQRIVRALAEAWRPVVAPLVRAP